MSKHHLYGRTVMANRSGILIAQTGPGRLEVKEGDIFTIDDAKTVDGRFYYILREYDLIMVPAAYFSIYIDLLTRQLSDIERSFR